MFGTRWRLLKMAGIPIHVDASWLIILGLVTVSLVNLFPSLLDQFFPQGAHELRTTETWGIAFLTALGFFACILLHELGHAIVGRALGIPIQGITLFMFGGVAELGEEPPSALSEFWMAIAGPLVSLFLAIVLAIAAGLGMALNWPPPLVVAFIYLASINGMLLLFNMVPAFPLDGGRVLRSILWGATGNLTRATRWATWIGQGFGWLLIGVGIVQFVEGNWFGGIWTGLIAMFLLNAARQSYAQVVTRQMLEHEPIRTLMSPEPVVVSPALDLRHWMDDFVHRYHRKTFPVAYAGHLLGSISTEDLSQIPRDEWDQHAVREVMDDDVDAISISPSADAWQALEKMQRSGVNRLLVTENDELVGAISLKSLADLLNWKIELGEDAAPAPRQSEFDGRSEKPHQHERANHDQP